jgi:hypothetical protein
MKTLLLERDTPMDTLFSFMGATGQVRIEKGRKRATITPVGEPDGKPIDPADYPDDTAYLCAIPGFVERITTFRNAPDSEFEEIPEKYFHA